MSVDDELTVAPETALTGTVARWQGTRGAAGFTPGAIVAGRYRLVALLGRGGMGEVYRADDLVLDQPVALKFLPQDVAANDARLTQFHNELRVARQVSHKNVCRLYDLGETDGRPFLTMEYVDGENLSGLLRRIGRFPQDRAVAIARQLCAGVAAAHERGVIHRDLKPANVMIDGEGNVRITDFGIATAAADVGTEMVGTPQYMAPEQLSGQPASPRTDIYSLGLILFEVFTGRRVYEASSLNELKAQHDTGVVTTPSTIVRDLDPTVESVILRCLSKDPEGRPGTALAVAAALPGADPLAAALAAGETPSPDLVAAAGEREALPVLVGLACVAWILAGLWVAGAVAPRLTFARLAALDKPPAVLADRAEQILATFGYTEPRAATAHGFQLIGDYIDWIARTDQRPERWIRLGADRPAAMLYWYRTSPRTMVPRQLALRVTPNDPALNDSNMHAVVLDMRGRLLQFNSVPPQFDPEPAGADRSAPWPQLFEAAGLSMSTFVSVAPEWTPPDFADVRAAWEGPLPGQSDLRVRVEAAAYRNQPVSFNIIGPWTRPARMQPPVRSFVDRSAAAIVTLGGIILTLGAAFLARHNLHAKRADVGGATKLAVATFAIEMSAWVFGFQHVSDLRSEVSSLAAVAGDAALVSVILWTMYAAFEPYCRRFWPDMLLGWSRFLSGHLRDPRVGRDVLAGLSFGVLWLLIDFGRRALPQLFGHPPILLRSGGELMFTGAVDAERVWAILAIRSLTPTFSAVMLFVVLRLITKRARTAIGLGMVLMFAWWYAPGSSPMVWLEALVEAVIVALFTLLMIRFGLLAAIIAYFVFTVSQAVPLTLNAAHWSSGASNETLAFLLVLTLSGFYAARGGEPLFGTVDI